MSVEHLYSRYTNASTLVVMFRFPALALLGVMLTVSAFRPSQPLPEPATSAKLTADFAVTDTLFFGGAVGDLVIVQLPEEISQGRVSEWSLTRGPALSWLYGSSFFWRTLPDEYGVHRIDVEATTGGDKEKVVVLISLD